MPYIESEALECASTRSEAINLTQRQALLRHRIQDMIQNEIKPLIQSKEKYEVQQEAQQQVRQPLSRRLSEIIWLVKTRKRIDVLARKIQRHSQFCSKLTNCMKRVTDNGGFKYAQWSEKYTRSSQQIDVHLNELRKQHNLQEKLEKSIGFECDDSMMATYLNYESTNKKNNNNTVNNRMNTSNSRNSNQKNNSNISKNNTKRNRSANDSSNGGNSKDIGQC